MAQRGSWEWVRVQGGQVLQQLNKLIHEGNVRRVVVKQGGRSIAEFPLTVGVVGAVAAPVLAAVGALVALLTDCTLEVERRTDRSAAPEPSAAATPTPRRRPKAKA